MGRERRHMPVKWASPESQSRGVFGHPPKRIGTASSCRHLCPCFSPARDDRRLPQIVRAIRKLLFPMATSKSTGEACQTAADRFRIHARIQAPASRVVYAASTRTNGRSKARLTMQAPTVKRWSRLNFGPWEPAKGRGRRPHRQQRAFRGAQRTPSFIQKKFPTGGTAPNPDTVRKGK
jgi:hypothetical protein